MSAPILVTGGTGTLGRLLVPRLRDAGQDVRVLSRGRHEGADGLEFFTGDLATGDGIDASLAGIETVVHLAGASKGDEHTTARLVQAASESGVRHVVFISVVGADKVPVTSAVDRALFGYVGSKLAAERVVSSAGLPWTTMRATQFHQLMFNLAAQMAKLPVLPVPAGIRVQPIDAVDVADRLVELALGPPAGLVPDIGGPRVYRMADLLRGYLRSRSRHRLLVPLPLPGKAARAFRDGANLTPDRAVGRRTWEDFLADRLRSSSGGAEETAPTTV
jgi:uncharacterized protein YbjT (DUF2867 family)